MKIFRLVFSPIDVNTYIVADENGDCAVIDCGCYDDNEFKTLVSFLDEKKLKPVTLLNTHCHLDHIFGNRLMLEKYGLRSRYSQPEDANRRLAPNHAAIFGLEMPESPAAEEFIKHGDIILAGNISFIALDVPGHTAGSLAFYSEAHGVVFTGDALFAGSIGRTDLPGGNFDTLLNSIRSNLLTLPGETVVYPGHGDKTTIDTERTTNPYLT